MIYVALALAGGYPVVLIALLRFLRERDQSERIERAALLQRIQAPEVAVAQAATVEDRELPAVNPTLDDDYWQAQEATLARISEYEQNGILNGVTNRG